MTTNHNHNRRGEAFYSPDELCLDSMTKNASPLPQNNLHYIGNKQILEHYKVAFLCSRKCPADIILKSYDWAIEQREKGVCVISGFSFPDWVGTIYPANIKKGEMLQYYEQKLWSQTPQIDIW